MVEQQIIVRLIEIGRHSDVLDPLDKISKAGVINRQLRKFWNPVCAPLSDTDLISLIKGMIAAETVFKWGGGSAASGIWLFEILVSRGLSTTKLDEVAAWVVEHRWNDYVPFGTNSYHKAKTLTDFIDQRERHQRRAGCNLAIEASRAEASSGYRVWQMRARETSVQQRLSKKRKSLIVEMQALPLPERLKVVAADRQFHVTFYPTSWADSATEEAICSLDIDIRLTLARKLLGKHRGPWGGFKKRLLKGLPNNIWDQ